jgi:hypothetical protein
LELRRDNTHSYVKLRECSFLVHFYRMLNTATQLVDHDKNRRSSSARCQIGCDNLGPLTPPQKLEQLEAMGYRTVPGASDERHGIIPKYE